MSPQVVCLMSKHEVYESVYSACIFRGAICFPDQLAAQFLMNLTKVGIAFHASFRALSWRQERRRRRHSYFNLHVRFDQKTEYSRKEFTFFPHMVPYKDLIPLLLVCDWRHICQTIYSYRGNQTNFEEWTKIFVFVQRILIDEKGMTVFSRNGDTWVVAFTYHLEGFMVYQRNNDKYEMDRSTAGMSGEILSFSYWRWLLFDSNSANLI